MDTLPPEIRSIIYCLYADHKLYAMCATYKLNYDKLINFLRKYKAAIYGSAALSCFGYGSPINDYLNIIIIDSELFAFLKTRIYRTAHEKLVSQHCIKDIDIPQRINILVGRKEYFSDVKQFIKQTTDIDKLAIIFDGYEWYNPYIPIIDIIETNYCYLIDPFLNNEYDVDVSETLNIVPDIIAAQQVNLSDNHKRFIDNIFPQTLPDKYTSFNQNYQKFS